MGHGFPGPPPQTPGVTAPGSGPTCGGLERIVPQAKVLLKPNVVFWTAQLPLPKWGLITTSRVVQDMVHLLKEQGIDDITIVEGMVLGRQNETQTAVHAFESLGYNKLKQRPGP